MPKKYVNATTLTITKSAAYFCINKLARPIGRDKTISSVPSPSSPAEKAAPNTIAITTISIDICIYISCPANPAKVCQVSAEPNQFFILSGTEPSILPIVSRIGGKIIDIPIIDTRDAANHKSIVQRFSNSIFENTVLSMVVLVVLHKFRLQIHLIYLIVNSLFFQEFQKRRSLLWAWLNR